MPVSICALCTHHVKSQGKALHALLDWSILGGRKNHPGSVDGAGDRYVVYHLPMYAISFSAPQIYMIC